MQATPVWNLETDHEERKGADKKGTGGIADVVVFHLPAPVCVCAGLFLGSCGWDGVLRRMVFCEKPLCKVTKAETRESKRRQTHQAGAQS